MTPDAAHARRPVALREEARALEDFRASLVAGLSQRRKAIPCRFLYDAAGSELFERICELPEYYLTRTETRILEAHAGDIAALAGPDALLVELGSGASRKVRLLLDALARPRGYVAIDISREHLLRSTQALAAAYPGLAVEAVCADYSAPLALPDIPGARRRLGFFPGSTVGNLTRREAGELLALWRETLGPGSAMVVGVDLKKDKAVLEAAYDDAAGVTAAFSKNVLVRANRELGADFDLARFAHEARYVADRGAVEIHLVSRAAQRVRVAGRAFDVAEGERIHIEDSRKYSPAEFAALAGDAGFASVAVWTDEDALFAVHYLQAD